MKPHEHQRYSDFLNGKTLGTDLRIRDIFEQFEEVEVVRVFPMKQALEWQEKFDPALSPFQIAQYFVGNYPFKDGSKFRSTLCLSLTTENVITYRCFGEWEPGMAIPNYAILRNGTEVSDSNARGDYASR